MAYRNNDENVVDIEKCVDSLTRLLEDVPLCMRSRGHPGRISRIPQNLREIDLKAYEPYFMSFGPYHHGKENVQRMEKRKYLVLRGVLDDRPEITLKHYLKEIKSIEPEARSFYSDIEMESQKFVKMLLLDSLYIVTMFCEMVTPERFSQTNTITGSRVNNEDEDNTGNMISEGKQVVEDTEKMNMLEMPNESHDEQMSGNCSEEPPRWSWMLLLHDLFLLENQLPFFVLQKVYEIAYGGSKTQLLSIMKGNIVNWLSNYTKLDSDKLISGNEEVHHLLHLCHLFFHPTLQHESTACQKLESPQMFRLGSAVQLYEAGVIFEVRSRSTQHTMLDITFDSSGKIVMPCLYVDDSINSLLRNLIALEQMKYPSLGLDVSSYAVLLLHLVTTTDDVELLRRKGIIHHHLASDKEMMYLVNRLSVGLSFDYIEDKYSLKPVFHALKRYTEHRVPRWRAWLKHTHFRNPWTVISLVAGSLLLTLTVLQTFYTVNAYYNPYFSDRSRSS